MRRYLTEEFVSTAKPPKSGEVWVADTGVHGFGLRMWAPDGVAFCIRTKDQNGRSVRRTFEPYQHISSMRHVLSYEEFGKLIKAGSQLHEFLDLARKWAKLEIRKLKGQDSHSPELAATNSEYQQAKKNVSRYLLSKPLDDLVQSLIRAGWSRGWSLEYSDRLWNAFNAFDPDGSIRSKTVAQLQNGKLVDHFYNSPIGVGNARLVRFLLKTIADNLQGLGGPYLGPVFYLRGQKKAYWHKDYHTLSQLTKSDYENLFCTLKASKQNWVSFQAIEFCLFSDVSISRVLSGKWSDIEQGVWNLTYHKRNNQVLRLSKAQLQILENIRNYAESEGIKSEFWFPSPLNSENHVQNIDRTWQYLLREANWPKVSLRETSHAFRGFCAELVWP